MNVDLCADLNAFPDEENISANWALDGMEWVAATGLMKGRRNGEYIYLEPKEKTMRSELATVLYRFCTTAIE